MNRLSKVLTMLLLFCITAMTCSNARIAAATEDEKSSMMETILFTGTAVGARWKVATSVYTTNQYGSYDPYLITKDGYFYVEYTGKKGSVALVLVEVSSSKWASIMPSSSGKTKKGYYSIFRYKDCVDAYGTDDFSDLDVVHVSGGAAPVTVKTLKWIGRPAANELGADAVLFHGSIASYKANQMITYFYTGHAGGYFDAALINEDSYFYLEYTGAADGLSLAFSSASGGKKWAVINASETGSTDSGTFYSIFTYDDFSKAYGTNFTRLDQIFVYSTKDAVTLKCMAYFAGEGAPTNPSDGSWDREYEGIAFLGDSIIQNPLLYYGDWNSILGRTDCDNWGIGGQTTEHIEARIDDMLKGSYHKIVILCGTNDIGHWMALSETITNYKSIFKKIEKALPEAEVYVISILPKGPAVNQSVQNTIKTMNTAIKKLAADYDKVTFVDCYSSFIDKEGNSIGDYYSDNTHPSEKGYQVIGEVLLPYLEKESN